MFLQLVSAKQHELQMDPMQLLYYQAPISSAMLFVVVMCVESPFQWLMQDWSLLDMGMVLMSCITAFFVNLSIYWIIGNTSPLTYNMVGHLKFCLTVMGGFLIFKEPLTFMQGIGVVMTVLGVTTYAHVKVSKKKMNYLVIF